MDPGCKARAFVSLVACVLLLAAACGGKDADKAASPAAAPPGTTASGKATTSPAGAIGEAATVAPTFGPVANEPVAFQTDDGVAVRGHFYAAPGPKRKVAVLAHQNGSDQKSWAPFAQELASHGVAALTFDFRGFGETGGNRDISKIDHDLDAAVRFVHSRDYPQIYVLGASMGGTAALKVAARQDLSGIVAVSAPISFEGLSAQSDVANVSEPKLFVASRNDPNGAAAALATLLQIASGPKDSQLYDGAAHGAELLQGANSVAFKQRLIEFIEK